jgi:hypothetical protein
MGLRNFINKATMGLMPLLVGASAYWIASGHYRLALAAIVCAALCAEARVRAGYTLPRERNFILHIFVGILLLCVVVGLSVWPMPAWVAWLALLLLAAVAYGGGTMLVRHHLYLK